MCVEIQDLSRLTEVLDLYLNKKGTIDLGALHGRGQYYEVVKQFFINILPKPNVHYSYGPFTIANLVHFLGNRDLAALIWVEWHDYAGAISSTLPMNWYIGSQQGSFVSPKYFYDISGILGGNGGNHMDLI